MGVAPAGTQVCWRERMSLIDLKCAQCGAALPPQQAGGIYRCNYCGHSYENAPPPPPPQVQVQINFDPQLVSAIEHSRAARDAMRAVRTGASTGIKIGCIMPFLITALVVGIIWMQRGGTSSLGITGIGGITAPRVIWDSFAQPPMPVTVAGKEAILGRVRMDGDQLHVVAITAADAKIVWSSAALGTYSQGYQSTHFVALKGRVLVSDYQSSVHVLDINTGKEVVATKLTDRVEHMCAAGPDSVWIGTVDKRGSTMAVATGATHEGVKPAVCEDAWARLSSFSRDKPTMPKVVGFEGKRVLVDGDLAVAAGVRSPGTAIPMAVGYDPKTLAPRWTTQIPVVDASQVRANSSEHEAFSSGKFISIYGVGDKSWHLTAIDAKTGARLWDTVLPKIFAVDSINNVIGSPNHVYVGRTSSVEMFDATSGKRIGAVGSETYRD